MNSLGCFKRLKWIIILFQHSGNIDLDEGSSKSYYKFVLRRCSEKMATFNDTLVKIYIIDPNPEQYTASTCGMPDHKTIAHVLL